MRCIFCKEESSASVSIEHIIPEALGNTKHTLPPGIVCDICNNYFARKIEGPLLASMGFKNLRGRQRLQNKRGIIPTQTGFFPAAQISIELDYNDLRSPTVSASSTRDEKVFIECLRSRRGGSFYLPINVDADKRLISRFLGKVAIEVLAHRTLGDESWNDEIVDHSQLDLLREYVRRNIGDTWPYFSRRIYDEDEISDDGYQMLHEYTILVTPEEEYYLVLCLFGVEYSINFAGPELDGYNRWLTNNGNKSPLYP